MERHVGWPSRECGSARFDSGPSWALPMKIEVNLCATLASHLPDEVRQGDRRMELGEGTTIGELLQQLRIPHEAAKLVFLNGVRAEAAAVLRDGDRVGVFPPIGGG